MWDLVPYPGIEPSPPVSRAQSLSHWTTREFPQLPSESFQHDSLSISLGLPRWLSLLFGSVPDSSFTFPVLNPGVSHFSRIPGSFIGEWYLETKIWGLNYLFLLYHFF